MEAQNKDLQDYIAAFRKRKKSILFATFSLFIISIIIAIIWPPTYRSTATILIEEQEVPPDLIRSTVTSYAAQRIQTINQRVMTRSNLMEIVDKYDLYSSKRRTDTTEEILDRMRKDVKVEMINADVLDPRTGQPRPATIAFTLAYDGEDATLTQKVASELTSLYLNENLKNRREKATETYTFLSEEANKLQEHITDLEDKVSVFKQKYAGRLPELTQINISLKDRTENELFQIESQVRTLEERKFQLEGQLAQINPLSPTIDRDSGQVILDPITQLKMYRSELISASAKYSSDHPDVIRLRRQIAALEKQTGNVNSSTEQAKRLASLKTELTGTRKRYSEDHPDVIRLTKEIAAQEEALRNLKSNPKIEVAGIKPDNPAYITLQSQLAGIKSEIQSLYAHRNELKGKRTEYENRLLQTPEVERQYNLLLRDYETATRRYQEIKFKQNQAQVGKELEKERKAEKFVLIDPPQLPEKPAKPNRPAVIIFGALLSIAGGLGYGSFSEKMDNSVRSPRNLTALLNAPPLSIIPYWQNAEDSKRDDKSKIIVILGIVTGVLAVLLLIHFLWTPLDVLWFKGLRKIDSAINI